MTRSYMLACGSMLALLASSMPAMAEAPEAEGAATGSNEIIVTANKREQNLNDVGMTLTALGAQALQERKVVSLEDLAGTVPGLVYTPSTTNTPIFTLRGVGFNESSLGVYPAVSVYMDQVPLSFPVLASHSAYDLERVEVLKGPQGTLFGQNSTGGAINYIAAKPTDELHAGADLSYGRFNQVDGNAYVSGPLGEMVNARLSVTGLHSDGWQQSVTRPGDTNGKSEYYAGRLQFDIKASDTVKINLSGNAWQDKSQPQAQQLIAIHEQVTATGPGPISAAPINDPLRNYISPPYVAGGLSGQLTTPFASLNPRSADWSGIRLDPQTSTAGPSGAIPIGSATTTDFTPFGNRKFWQLAGRADIELGTLTLTSLTSYSHYTQKQRTDGDGMALVAYDLQLGTGKITSFTQELRLSNDPHNRFRWVLGGNYEKSKTFENQLLRYFANSNYYPNNLYINASGDILNQDIRNYAGFANAEFEITPQLTFKAGGRYTNSKIDALNTAYTQSNGNVDKLFNIIGGIGGLPFTPIGPGDSYTLNSTVPAASIPNGVTINSPQSAGIAGIGIPGIPLSSTLKEHNFSWRVGLDYKASKDLLVYANISRGYKAGSYPALAAAAYISALPVTQESVTAYEAGFKATLADGKVQFNAAGFYYDYKNKQIRGKLFDFIFGTLDTLVNVPKSRIYGLEGDLTLRPTPGLTIELAGTYLNSKIDKFFGYDIFGGASNANFNPTGDNREDLSGNPIPYTPKYSGSINVDYKVHPGGEATPFFGFTVSARSKQDAAIGGGNTPIPVGPRYRLAPGVSNTPYTIDGYATVDARLGFDGPEGRWRVMLWGKNVFNKYYWTAVIPASDSSARFAGKPATYGVTVAIKY
ncbi:TonB-dependent receptor [Novosphingobium lentum]|uniref:TonB-dependent receptor n=1 Tax=Novosphingobium lentum TaxID=145287 RepID=UPI000A0073AD|nr:TonB-dependent receptor [Novosphingobium lentum]